MMPNLKCSTKSAVFPQLPLESFNRMRYFDPVTRAVPLVRKVNAYQGRVFLFPGIRAPADAAASPKILGASRSYGVKPRIEPPKFMLAIINP